MSSAAACRITADPRSQHIEKPTRSDRWPHTISIALSLLLAASVARLWLMEMPSSLWVDEMVTAFVAQHPGSPSYAIAPQVPASVYYWLPRMSHMFGNSEIAWRIPSMIAMGIALFIIGRLAARLIHPRAAWFAVFACLGVRGFNYYAIDARPYALGICIASAGLYFLTRWLDSTRRIDALLFILCGAMLWRVHLLYWPFYLVFAIYASARLARRDTEVRWPGVLGAFALIGASLVPVVIRALTVLHGASEHVIAAAPSLREFQHAIRWNLVVVAGCGAWLIAGVWRTSTAPKRPSGASLIVIASWWLAIPVCLYLFSIASGNSVFIGRYISLCLPGIALAATTAAALSVRDSQWPFVTLALAVGVLCVTGQWNTVWPYHDNSDWRGAARAERKLVTSSDLPVICPSPFIEARSPAWSPGYPLPGFLYANLPFYPVQGKLYLFPFESADGIGYARELIRTKLLSHGRFLLYGGRGNARFWREWFASQPELRGWANKVLEFGDVWVVEFTALK